MTWDADRPARSDADAANADAAAPSSASADTPADVVMRWLDKLIGLLLAIWRQGRTIHLPQTAGSLTLLSLLAIVPMFSIALTVVTALPMFAPMRESLQRFLASNLFLPSFADTLSRYTNEFASKASQLSLFGALFFFATAFTALLTIDRTLNQIWATERPRSLGRRVTLYWTLLTMGPLFLALSFAVNGMMVTGWLSNVPVEMFRRIWFTVLSAGSGFGALALMYYLLPNVQVRWRDAMLGAAVAAIAIELLRRGLTTYVANLPTYTVIYGAFAALPLFLIWLYLLWMTILLGALLAANLRHWGSGTRVHAQWRPAERFDAATRILLALAIEWQDDGDGLLTVESLKAMTGPDPGRADALARLLGATGYIHRHWRVPTEARRGEPERAIWDESWVLVRNPQYLSLRPLFEAIWQGSDDADPRQPAQRRSNEPFRRWRARDPAGVTHLAIESALLDAPLSVVAAQSVR
ncbi:MAG: YihY family inner membrane protein [Burkholderiaceae bacterium]